MTGTRIQQYEIQERIGEGMGVVYRALDTALEREVVIKVIRPDLAREPEVFARFRAEAVTLGKLQHPNICTLHALIAHDSDWLMVMEYVPGETLQSLIARQGALTWEQAREIFEPMLDAVGHAHANGVLHRDLKPANVIIAPGGKPKVIDFGIARSAGASRQTRMGRMVGTLEYMAPERLLGQAEDERADIYALGVILYEVLSGMLPFDDSSEYAIMRGHIEEKPRDPGAVPGIPRHVAQAISRALDKDPAGRFASCAEMREALVGLSSPAPRSAPVVPVKGAGARRLSWWLVFAVASALVLSAFLYWRPSAPEVRKEEHKGPASIEYEEVIKPAPKPVPPPNPPAPAPKPAPPAVVSPVPAPKPPPPALKGEVPDDIRKRIEQ